jgi:hypothetical protein
MPQIFDEMFECTWGDIRLFASSIEWEIGETLVVHDLAAGDEHPVQQRDKQLRTAKCDLMFDDFAGATESGASAFRRFMASIGERRIFTHPMMGGYFALIGRCTPTLDQDSVLKVSVEIVPDEPVQPITPAGATAVAAAADEVSLQLSEAAIGFDPKRIAKLDFSLSIEASVDAAFSAEINVDVNASANVSASATASASASASVSATAQAQANASMYAFAGVYAQAFAAASVTAVASVSGMADAGAFAFALASAALDWDARSTVASWTDEEDVPARKVMIDATRLSESLAAMIELGGLEHDLAMWPAFRAAILLGDTIRAAALSVMAETSGVFVMRVKTPMALLPLAARVYGGAQAQTRARQIAQMNEIRTPGWLEVGDYLMPARPADAAQSVEVG